MASLTDKTYFPPLEECLRGKIVILSWKLVAAALADTTCDRITSAAVSAFLKDPYVHQLLKEPSKAFEPPNAQSKTNFDTKTAAINVTPDPNDPFNITQLKSDAQWLSKNVNIGEVAALRIVVVEYQSRAQSHLTGPLSTQDIVNIQEAAGVSDAQTSTILALLNVSSVNDAETTYADFEKEEARRQRILANYLSERRSFMSALDSLVAFLLHSNATSRGPEADSLRRNIVKAAFGFDELDPDRSPPNLGNFEAVVPRYFSLLDDCIERSRVGPEKVDKNLVTEQLGLDWVRTALTEAIHAMALSFQLLDLAGPTFAPHEIVSQWFQFVRQYEFLDQLQGYHGMITELLAPLRSLVCVISLKLLNVERSILYLAQEGDLLAFEDPYLASSDILDQIHTTVIDAANANMITANPVILAWSLILYHMHLAYQERAERRDLAQNQRAQDGFELEYQQPSMDSQRSIGGRRNSAGSIVSIEKSPYDIFLSSRSLERDTSIAESLAQAVAAHGQFYDLVSEMSACLGEGQLAAFRPVLGARMRAVFLELIKQSYKLTGYKSEPVSCLLSVLEPGRQYWNLSSEMSRSNSEDVASFMLRDPEFLDMFLSQSLNRYPYEFLPFVGFCRLLSTCLRSQSGLSELEVSENASSELIMKLLLKTPSLTIEWKDDWIGYELIFEEDNTNSFKIIEGLDLFGTSLSTKRRPTSEEKFTIPAGTMGRFVSEVQKIALLEFEHSTIALLGKRLERNLLGDAYGLGLGLLTADEVSEAISLLATVLRVEVIKASDSASKGISEGLAVLAEASRSLPRTKDIVTVICDTLDGLIQEELVGLDGAKIAAMASCVQFLDATLAVCPGRIWSYMTRCGLINGETRAGRLSRITGNLEMFAERFEFLSSAVKLFSRLIDSAVTSAVQRKVGAGANIRSKGDENPWLGTSDKTLSRVSLSIAETAVDILENSATWRFPSEIDRSILVSDVVAIMSKLTSYTFSIGTPKSPKSLTSSLVPAARYVVESFVSTASSSLRFQPLLATLLVAFQIPDSSLYPYRSRIVSDRLIEVLNFSTTLLRVATYLDQPSTGIQTQFFKSASLIARLPAIRYAFKMPSLTLLSALVESVGRGNNEPPSLLGYLGPQISRSFIQIASQMDKPFNRMPEVLSTWRFFSTIMRNRQQWMANCLLTGKTPREALKGNGRISSISPESVLATALETLRSIKTTPTEEIIAVLDFFTSAQNYWPWTIFAMQKDTTFLDGLRSYVRELQAPSDVSKSDARQAGNQARIAAYIAETFAMQLYHLRQMGKSESFATNIVNDLDYFLRSGVKVDGYNTSLHVNFAKNFSNRYTGCSVDDFKRTGVVPRDIGSQYYYALDVSETMLGYDAGWAGPRENGFRHEMETANLNLSLVESEVALFHAWEYLLLELSISLLPSNPTVAMQMLQVAEQCLESNQRQQPPENIFIRVTHARANLALHILQRLADSSRLPKDITKLLTNISVSLYGVEDPYGRDQISYFRTLLKILFVILKGSRHSANSGAEKTSPTASIAVTQQVLTIIDRVVGQSFKTLVALVHDPESPTTAEDLAIITAILQACLSVPGIDQCQVQVLNIMSSHDVMQVAISLFSWADKLADKGDPIYGEIALLFLLELSALPAVAEQLACDGLLGHLTSANVTGFMRRPNVSPFSDNAGAARCYGIWAKGILPLLLNILGALGATITPEVAFVLNQFPSLLRSSVERFEAPGQSRTAARDTPSFIALIAISEIHSLALLTRVLSALRINNSRDIPEVKWDAGSVLENVEFWLSSRKILRERLLPLGPRETAWRATKAGGGGGGGGGGAEDGGVESVLEEKAVAQLLSVRDVLSED
ncbi:nucleoporin subcomplex protein binding to Pom34-domain-containing protein [Bombardia bombarda]|uniref:Nucleoporin NUP188 n=1 Tax=Bombardia bombarda TaxID=252184 RepID=A0AA39XQ11_9PEZI|nr:nucleoporin subcomplex protein binding to Pom34-domain-containing protein [Bombardia bombarda]